MLFFSHIGKYFQFYLYAYLVYLEADNANTDRHQSICPGPIPSTYAGPLPCGERRELRPPLKKVSCPAGGQNCGQSGGCEFFFSFNIFFSLCIEKMVHTGKTENVKKMFPFGTHKFTRAVDRKQHYFLRTA